MLIKVICSVISVTSAVNGVYLIKKKKLPLLQILLLKKSYRK